MQVRDATGTNKGLKINGQNRAYVQSVTKTEDHDINERSGKVWSVPFEDLNPAGADDYVAYIKNTGDAALELSDIRISATAATQIEVHVVTGTASGGSAVTPVSRTAGGSAVPDATIETGTDITGITNAGVLFFIQCPVAATEYHLRTSSKIHIPKGKAIALLVENGSADVTGVISIYEEGG